MTAFLAGIELAFFGTSLIGFRFFAAIASGFVAVLTGLMARAMGGGRQSMLVSAFAASIGGPVFFTGSFMSYMSFDLLWWVAVAWCVSRSSSDRQSPGYLGLLLGSYARVDKPAIPFDVEFGTVQHTDIGDGAACTWAKA